MKLTAEEIEEKRKLLASLRSGVEIIERELADQLAPEPERPLTLDEILASPRWLESAKVGNLYLPAKDYGELTHLFMTKARECRDKFNQTVWLYDPGAEMAFALVLGKEEGWINKYTRRQFEEFKRRRGLV